MPATYQIVVRSPRRGMDIETPVLASGVPCDRLEAEARACAARSGVAVVAVCEQTDVAELAAWPDGRVSRLE